MGVPPTLQNSDPAEAYKLLYDSLDDAYWEATDVGSKDLVHSVQLEVREILDALVHQQLATNTELFTQMAGKIKIANDALKKIQERIDQITKNITTAAKVVGAITKVLSLFP